MQVAPDWLGSARASVLAWGVPHAAIVLGLAVSPVTRTIIWIVALVWMGTACILNARRCGRTHCRFTGPYYLLMTIPVLVFGSGLVAVSFYAWVVLGVVIVLGSKMIWWASERAWGKFT
jgi:hypothetical protein